MTRILIIISSARQIDLTLDKGHTTGYFADEAIKPYDKFVAAGAEVLVATPDGNAPQIDPYALEPFFHYPDEDKDFLAQVTRSFSNDIDDIRLTLHQATELDLIAARRVFHALIASGLDHDSAWDLTAKSARVAWSQDKNFVDVLAANPDVTAKVNASELKRLASETQDAATAVSKYRAERIRSLETFQHPLSLAKMSDADMLSYDAIFFPGGHGPMVDLYQNADVKRILQLFHPTEKIIAAVCHGPAALLAAGEGPDGAWMFDGYKIAAFTDEEEDQTPFGKLGMPWLLEKELKLAGAVFDDGDSAWGSFVVADRNLLTGQNPESAEAIADAILKKVGTK